MNIFLAPIKFSNTSLLSDLTDELRKNFHSKIEIMELPIDYEPAFSKARSQYYSTQIIANTIPLTEKFPGKIIMLTEFDLYVPVLTFVFGEAQLSGKHSIVSVCRLHEEFYTGITDDKLLLKRTVKEVMHELGHNYGLRHCVYWDCVMHSSMGIEEVDIKGDKFCKNCAAKIEDYKHKK